MEEGEKMSGYRELAKDFLEANPEVQKLCPFGTDSMDKLIDWVLFPYVAGNFASLSTIQKIKNEVDRERTGIDAECYEWYVGGDLKINEKWLQHFVGGQVEIFEVFYHRLCDWESAHYLGHISKVTQYGEVFEISFDWAAEEKDGKWHRFGLLSTSIGPNCNIEKIHNGCLRFMKEYVEFRRIKMFEFGTIMYDAASKILIEESQLLPELEH